MKVCITTKTLGIGGAEVLLKMITPKLIAKGYQVDVLYFMKSKSDLVPYFESIGCNVKYIGDLDLKSFIPTALNYRKNLKRNSYDIIFDNSPLSSFLSRFFKSSSKVIYLEHNIWSAYNKVTYWLNKLTYKKNNEVICCSNEVFQSNGKVGLVLNNAIDVKKITEQVDNSDYSIRSELGISDDTRIIVSIANMSHRKNHILLIKAFESIKSSNVKLIIVGQKKEAFDSLNEYVSKSLRKQDIVLYGPSSNVAKILSESTVFSLTSYQEGLPISLLEAMALGVVPVCSNVGGISDTIGRDCGFVFESDDKENLVKYLEKILNDPYGYNEMSSLCVQRITNLYSLNEYVEKLNKVFMR